ncbi:hypothetical protein J6590_061830 [Homalodisca vitripennis]|nr:hypothetical protein J6590_061830 [Homalodisca vitripennis]
MRTFGCDGLLEFLRSVWARPSLTNGDRVECGVSASFRPKNPWIGFSMVFTSCPVAVRSSETITLKIPQSLLNVAYTESSIGLTSLPLCKAYISFPQSLPPYSAD